MENRVEEIRKRLGRGIVESADMYSLLDEIDRMNAEATPAPAPTAAAPAEAPTGGS
jgi:hypothetical protein